VVISHGFKAHSGHDEDVARQLNAADLAVYALDHRGRARSGGERFHVERLDHYVADLETFIRHVKTQEPGLPVFLL
jgi:alpha-beta hydrolase superfamily lysophospholipase